MDHADPRTVDQERSGASLARVHDGLLAMLVVLRPLVWDGDLTSPPNLIYLTLIVLALLLLGLEWFGGLRTTIRWSWLGIAGLLLATMLAPAAWNDRWFVASVGMWIEIALNLGFALYLMQVVPERKHLAWSALVAAVGGEVAISWIQGLIVLPNMTNAISGGNSAGLAEGISDGDLLERIGNGGWFGTFTLSNTLAAWLLVAAVPLTGSMARAWHEGSLRTRAWTALLVMAALGVLIGSHSKGALLALAVASGGWWMFSLKGPWRWLPAAAGSIATPVVWLTASHGLHDSAMVRWGYWQGAWKGILESPWAGLGWSAFPERGPALMPLWAEPSRLVHNEPLETALIAGIPTALLLIGILIALAWPRPFDRTAPPAADGLRPMTIPTVAVALLCAYLGVFGLLDGNVGWWPGGDVSLLARIGWTALAGVACAALMHLDLPLPSPLWYRLGLAALGLHCLIDFNLHSAAVTGTAITVAVLASSGCRSHPVSAVPKSLYATGLILLLCAVIAWIPRAMDLRNAGDLQRGLRLLQDARQRGDALASLSLMLGTDSPDPSNREGVNTLVQQAVERGLELSRDDPSLQVGFVAMMPPGAHRQELLDGLAVRAPWNPMVAQMRAEEHARRGRWDDALTEQRRAVACAPAHLNTRRTLISMLSRAAAVQPLRAVALLEEQRSEQAELERLTSVVHVRNR